jgi:DNA mismatch repair protein MutS2
LQPGARVFVPSLSAEGRVLHAPDARGRVKVAVGALTLDVDVAELGGAAAKGSPTKPARSSSPSSSSRFGAPGGDGDAPQADMLALTRPSATNTLDLRGRRADDVEDEVVAYLDRAALEGRSPVFVIHGHGTGALRKIVRELVLRSPYVRRWAPGEKGQGGDGVTVIELA